MMLSNRTSPPTQSLIRGMAFLYHVSLSVLFSTFTELLLDAFEGSYTRVAAFLGYVRRNRELHLL